MTEGQKSLVEAELAARECGPCFACCKWLGILSVGKNSLRKFPGQTCKFIDNQGDPTKLCSVYSNRPHACERYTCAWRMGFLDHDGGRPNESGLLISFYNSGTIDEIEEPAHITATIIIIDHNKCGDFNSGPLRQFIDEATIYHGISDIRIVRYNTRFVLHLKDGLIRQGNLLKSENPEELNFVTTDPPIGRWEIKEEKKQ